MKIKSFASFLSIASIAFCFTAANAATVHINENFDSSTSLPTGWSAVNNVSVINNVDYARSGTNSLWIVETRNSNIVIAPTLNLLGATEATIEFWWTTEAPQSSKFGRIPQVQYTSNGTDWTTIGSFTIPTSTSSIPPFTQFSRTITTSGGFAFTSTSTFRIVGDNDAGGSGGPAIIDDFIITSDAIPEPTTALLGGLGLLALLRRRR